MILYLIKKREKIRREKNNIKKYYFHAPGNNFSPVVVLHMLLFRTNIKSLFVSCDAHFK